MPFPANLPLRATAAAASLLVSIWMFYSAVSGGWAEKSRQGVAVFFGVLFVFAALLLIAGCIAKLHFVPEGITVTFLGRTVRRVPAERIKLLGGMTQYHRHRNSFWIAICDRTLEELAELGDKENPEFLRNKRTWIRWAENSAEKYLQRRIQSAWQGFNADRHILWLEWDAERLKALRQMYPNAQWVDFTDKKRLDKQVQTGGSVPL